MTLIILINFDISSNNLYNNINNISHFNFKVSICNEIFYVLFSFVFMYT